MSAMMTLLGHPTMRVEQRKSGVWLVIEDGTEHYIAISMRDADDPAWIHRPTLAEFLRPAVEWAAAHPELAQGRRETDPAQLEIVPDIASAPTVADDLRTVMGQIVPEIARIPA